MIFEVEIEGRPTRVEVTTGSREGYRKVRVGEGPEQEIAVVRPEAGVLSLVLDGAAWDVGLVPTEQGFDVDVRGERIEVSVVDPRRKALRLSGTGGKGTLKTTMPGRVVRILVEEGATVAAGQPVMVVEAMKMENELKAPKGGLVRRIAVATGALVEAGALLLEIDDPPATSDGGGAEPRGAAR